MKNKCEHIIGLYYEPDDNELVTLNDLKFRIDLCKWFNEQCTKNGIDYLKNEEWTLKDYADKRRATNLTRFNYCPVCGDKIDLKKMIVDKEENQ